MKPDILTTFLRAMLQFYGQNKESGCRYCDFKFVIRNAHYKGKSWEFGCGYGRLGALNWGCLNYGGESSSCTVVPKTIFSSESASKQSTVLYITVSQTRKQAYVGHLLNCRNWRGCAVTLALNFRSLLACLIPQNPPPPGATSASSIVPPVIFQPPRVALPTSIFWGVTSSK